MIRQGKELDFISWIKRDGSGVIPATAPWSEGQDRPQTGDMSYLDDESFTLVRLSLTQKTFIAHSFNSWVVRLKEV